jgi:hypothetical protein
VEGQFPGGGKSEKVYDETGLTAVMLGQSMGVNKPGTDGTFTYFFEARNW